jgi:hypothetical protein
VIVPVAREQNTTMDLPFEPKFIDRRLNHRRTKPARGRLADLDRCHARARSRSIDGCVDDHTVEEDGIEGFMMRIYNGPKTVVDIPLLARRRLTVYWKFTSLAGASRQSTECIRKPKQTDLRTGVAKERLRVEIIPSWAGDAAIRKAFSISLGSVREHRRAICIAY